MKKTLIGLALTAGVTLSAMAQDIVDTAVKAGNFKTPMLVSVGENDFRVPEGNALAMFAALQRMGVPSRLIVWPDENHWILKGENSRVFYREVRTWLEKYLLGGAGTQ